MLLIINSREFEGKTEADCIYNAWNEYEKLTKFMAGYLTAYDKYDDEGEYIPTDYTAEQLCEAYFSAVTNNPGIFETEWKAQA